MAADMNPGVGCSMTNGDTSVKTDVTAVKYNDSRKVMARGNSNNHQNEGQNVVYCDAHVDWQATCFAGPGRVGKTYNDNIYTSYPGGATADGSKGSLAASASPYDAPDALCLPALNAAGTGTAF